MNPSPVLFILACLPALVITLHGLEEISTEEGNLIYSCFEILLCKKRTASHFRAMYLTVGPVCQVKAFEWFVAVYKMDVRDEPVFWNTFPDIECNKTDKVKREQVKEFWIKAANYYEEACMIPTSEECIGMNKALEKAREIVTHYTAIGVCENGSQAAQKGLEQAQNFGEGLKKAPKPGFMSGR